MKRLWGIRHIRYYLFLWSKVDFYYSRGSIMYLGINQEDYAEATRIHEGKQ